MAIKLVNVKLKDGVDQNSFVSEFDSVSEVSVNNLLPNIPTLVVFNVEESYLSTLQSHSSVEVAEEEAQAFPSVTYPSQPSTYTLSGKNVTADLVYSGVSGTDFISYQHYLDTDIMQKDGTNKLGYGIDYSGSYSGSLPNRPTYDENYEYTGQTYSSRYTGKHVDIVALEVGPLDSTYSGLQDSHPEFDNPDNTGNTRCVPTNWNGCSSDSNNQVTSNSMFDDGHAIGTLSAAGGIHGGISKKSNLYAIYLYGNNTNDSLSACCNAIIHFHNNKSTNGTTGLKNPTIVIGEFQYLFDTYYGIKITNIASVTDPTGGTTNRPVSGWGSDFTPFTSRNIFPYRVQDPDDDSWHWMVTFPIQSQSSSMKTSLDALHTNGIIFINAAGNNGGTFVKESDSRWSGTYCTIDSGGVDRYNITNSGGVSSPGTIYGGTYYPFRAYGPHGLDKGIDVAAGQNSETHPMLDAYTNRGPGIDIVGRGAYTFTAYPSSTDSNGFKWGNFSGTSCATPTVVGKAACMMEEYYTLNGAWPNFTQVKNMLQTEARNGNNRVLDPASTTWSNVPVASGNNILIFNQIRYPFASSLLRIPKTGNRANGLYTFAELAGTPNFLAFWNARGYSREQTMDKRPTSGVMYPRPRNISNIE